MGNRIGVYIELGHLLWILLICLGVLYWWSAYGIKQLALQATKVYCKKMELQMLDESIALRRISLKRDQWGRLKLLRFFNFEFASIGDERYRGTITMHGRHCVDIRLEAHKI